MAQVDATKNIEMRKKVLKTRADSIRSMIPRVTQLELKLEQISDETEEEDLPKLADQMKSLKL